MKIVVTGGAGFIGSNLIHHFIDNYDDEVINVDKLTYAGNLDNLKNIEDNPNYNFYKGDISNKNFIDSIFTEEIDYVINLAAESHVDRSIENPNVFINTNILGTQVLLNAAKKYNVKKFIQVSTDEVYGSLGKNGYFTEDMPLKPNSPYSASKASADLMVRSYKETFNLPVNITRCSNNYGPYQFPEKLIPLFTTNALENKELPLYGDGKNIRDWLHVKDHCKAIDLVMRRGQNGEIYNIGGNNEKTNIEITNLILENLNKSKSLINYVEDRPGHDRRYAIDSTKIKDELGWKPKYTFKEGIKETIKWYKENKDWWKKIKNIE